MLGNNLREFRQSAGLGVTELAKLAGCDKSMISKIEHHKVVPSAKLMVRIANVLGKPVWRIFFQPAENAPYPDRQTIPDSPGCSGAMDGRG